MHYVEIGMKAEFNTKTGYAKWQTKLGGSETPSTLVVVQNGD